MAAFKLPNVMELEEFRYKFGDSRPVFLNYLLTLSNIAYLGKKVTHKQFFQFNCNPAVQKRKIDFPKQEFMSKIDDLVKNKEKPLVLVPVMMTNKLNCKLKNNAHHVNALLFNKNTNEFERFDIKKYHLDGFSLKLFIKNIKNTIIPYWNTLLGQPEKKIRLVNEVDIIPSFKALVGELDVRKLYPLFLLTYLRLRNDNPDKNKKEIIELVKTVDKNIIIQEWNRYLKFAQKAASRRNRCEGSSQVHNLETGRCFKIDSRVFNKHVIHKMHKECPRDLVFNQLTGRCVSKNKLVDVDVLLDQVSDIKIAKVNFENITHGSNDLMSVSYVLSQYPYARLVYPVDSKKKTIMKKDYRIGWLWNPKTNNFDFLIPNGFWEKWADLIYDTSVRFIIGLISLASNDGGHHANVLIHDKSTNEIERFDGLGSDISTTYEIDKFDERIRNELLKVSSIPQGFKYLTPIDFCPKIPIFQAKELDDIPGHDLGGNCAVWRLWYIHIRIANPNLTRKQLVKYAIKKLEQAGSLYRFIKSYQLFILNKIKPDKFALERAGSQE